MIYTSQFRKIDPYDWFYGPGLHIYKSIKNPAYRRRDA